MSPPANPGKAPTTIAPHYSPLPALLSYLIPGLGQIYQGRVGKGLLFLVCIYTLFFYGQYLGSGSGVIDDKPFTVSSNVYLPDVAQGSDALRRLVGNLYNRPQFLGQFWVGIMAWPALIQYNAPNGPHPLLGDYQRTPDEAKINLLENYGSKTRDLGWVFTVVAGVLNLLVIYDALAGPAYVPASRTPSRTPKEAGEKNAPVAAGR